MFPAEKMKKLRHVVLHGVCDNQILSILGQNCTVLQYLDITGSSDVTDLGIQGCIFYLKPVLYTCTVQVYRRGLYYILRQNEMMS